MPHRASEEIVGAASGRRKPQGYLSARIAVLHPSHAAESHAWREDLVVAHGNSLRSLVMVLDKLSLEAVNSMTAMT
jgi:hypothetical protein